MQSLDPLQLFFFKQNTGSGWKRFQISAWGRGQGAEAEQKWSCSASDPGKLPPGASCDPSGGTGGTSCPFTACPGPSRPCLRARSCRTPDPGAAGEQGKLPGGFAK